MARPARAGWLTTPVPVSEVTPLVAMGVGVVLDMGPVPAATTHLSTLTHEFGHGLIAALLGGRIDRITVALDGSGVARWSVVGSSMRSGHGG